MWNNNSSVSFWMILILLVFEVAVKIGLTSDVQIFQTSLQTSEGLFYFLNGFLNKPTHLPGIYVTVGAISMCLYSRRSWAAFVTVLLVQNQECRHLLHTWQTIEWIPLLFPGHLPVLGIVAVGSGLALIIFGISSFLIYRWVSHPADACFLRGQIPILLLLLILLLYRFDWSNLYMCNVVFKQVLPRQQLSGWC